MRKIRFRYIKENGKSTSVTVRCSVKRNASLISEALRHYQRLERQNDGEISTRKLDKQNRRHYQHVNECKLTSAEKQLKSTTIKKHFDPIQLRRKQCSSTLIDEETPKLLTAAAAAANSNVFSPSSSSGFRSHSDTSSNDELEMISKRANIIKEIFKTEYDYIRHLKNLVDGYAKKMRLRPDLFSNKQIDILMGNIEEIYDLQQSFFQLLRLSIDEHEPANSFVGKCFLLFKEEFKKYATYCINHPLSCLELSKLETNANYRNFFETCRLQANMIELKLDGFLLTPIQRICQYPLQLNQLLKSTPIEHRDYRNVEQAVDAMRNVANYINEKKRQVEYGEIICKWQKSIENWQGKDLKDTSTQGLGRADAYLCQNGKKDSVILFLFDHVLIICKKDRRNLLIYLDRANLDQAEIENLNDEEQHHLFAWRLIDHQQNKTYLFSHRSPLDKIQMIDALEYERAYVEENQVIDMHQYTQLTTSFPSITKQCKTPNRSISAILRTSCSPCTNRSMYETPIPRRKSSLPRFVRCSSPDSSIDESFRSIKSRFRFWS